MRTLKRIAPIFPVRDLSISIEHYRRLGFEVRQYDSGYGFANREGVEIHLGVAPDESKAGTASAYIWVKDAELDRRGCRESA